MIKIIGGRLAASVPTILFVMLVAFLLLELMPGDPATTIAGEFATDEQIAQLRDQLGLSGPLLSRFGSYVGDTLSGDLGTSLYTGREVSTSIAESLPPTLSLGLVAITMAVVGSLVVGMAAARRPGGVIDRLVSATSAISLAAPSFVIALGLVSFFALSRSWFPATGYAPLTDGVWEWLRHLALPAFALALASWAELVRQVRGSMVDTMELDYIRSLRASGLKERTVVFKHGLRNAASPMITVLGLQVGRILGSAVVIEQVFAIPGFGSLAFRSVLARDLPLIQGVILVSAIAVLITNLAVDMIYPVVNPRLRS